MSCRLLTSCGKGRRASLCIDADDGWVHGNRSSKEGKKKWGVGAVGRHWMSNSLTSPSTALWIFAPLSAHRMRSLLSALCIGNEAASDKAAMCGYVTSRSTVSLEGWMSACSSKLITKDESGSLLTQLHLRHGSQQNLSLTITEWVTHKTMAVKKISPVNIPIDSWRLHALLFVNAKSCSTD